MWGAIIGGAMQLASSLYGGYKASKAMENYRRGLEAEKSANADWYNRRYYEDATQRADAQAILRRTEQAIRERNKQARGMAATTGGTEEANAANRQANADAMANAVSTIAENAEKRKDTIESQYNANRAALNKEMRNMEIQKAQNISNAAAGVGRAFAGAADALEPKLTDTAAAEKLAKDMEAGVASPKTTKSIGGYLSDLSKEQALNAMANGVISKEDYDQYMYDNYPYLYSDY